MITPAALARRMRHLEAQIGHAGDGMVRVVSGMRGLKMGIEAVKARHRPALAPQGLTGMAAMKAEIARAKAMIEARELAEPIEPPAPQAD